MSYLDQFLKVIVAQGGSDLHIGEGQPPKMRKHGDVAPIRVEPMLREETMSMLREVTGEHNWNIFEERGDLDFAYEMDQASRFRCNYLKQANGYGAVFRLIPTKIATLDELGIPLVVKEFGHLRGGLVLVTGPTGSGKSTTLAALIDYINENFSRHIVTIEEPIEFVHENKRSIITQREVPGRFRSFPEALKAALREDADIVLVGEMRDLETISLALTAAETGLLVFGTLAHEQRAQNGRSNGRRFPGVATGAGARHARELAARRARAIALEESGWLRPRRRQRNPDRECGRLRDHSRRRHAKTSGRDRLGQSPGDAIYGRRHLGAAATRHGHAARSVHESDR